MRGIFPGLIFAIIFLIVTIPLVAAKTKETPSLIITTLDGKNFNLEEKRGKIVIVNFWAKWCVDCRKEVAILDEIYHKYKSHNLEIIGINIDRKRERQKILEISSLFSYPNSMFYEAKKSSFEEPNFIPLTYVIDKNGNLTTKILPSKRKLTIEDFEGIIKPLL